MEKREERKGDPFPLPLPHDNTTNKSKEGPREKIPSTKVES
jgi:hypothetical protein